MVSKILTVIVPCFNSQGYMNHCIDSLLTADNDELEILIINDGSTDNTAGIADDYASANPAVIRTIHQENRGHGGAVNTGMSEASGVYLKVVDSDDWVDEESFRRVLSKLKELERSGTPADLIVSNYVYEKEGARFHKTVHYRNTLPQGRVFGWADVRPFRKSQYMLMHSLIYRTSLLIECKLQLPLHTFYVDNLFAFIPLNHVKRIYYVDTNLYRYYIGRADQSVNESVMLKRIDQQLKINKIMLEHMLESSFDIPQLRRYMRHYLEIIITVSSILLIRSRQKEFLEEKKELWLSVKHGDRGLYFRLRFGLLGLLTNLPGEAGRIVSISCYKISRRFVGFN